MEQKIVVSPSLKDQVYSYLKEAIVRGELQFGSFYSVQWVASRLGVSRTPVREAVQQLQHEGLIDVFPYKGFTVKAISPAVIEEVFEVREAIESFCIKKLLAQYGTPAYAELMVMLERTVEEQKYMVAHGKDAMDYWKLDKGFHRRIVEFCNNKVLSEVYESISDKISSIALATLQDRSRFASASEEHALILAKLKEGSHEAVNVNVAHLLSTKKLIMKTWEKWENNGQEDSFALQRLEV